MAATMLDRPLIRLLKGTNYDDVESSQTQKDALTLKEKRWCRTTPEKIVAFTLMK